MIEPTVRLIFFYLGSAEISIKQPAEQNQKTSAADEAERRIIVLVDVWSEVVQSLDLRNAIAAVPADRQQQLRDAQPVDFRVRHIAPDDGRVAVLGNINHARQHVDRR